MASMKSWLEKIKNRILKKDLDTDLLESKIQSEEEIVKEKALPDLITPTNEEINEIQREEAIRLNEMHESEKIIESKLAKIQSTQGLNKVFVHFTDVPKRTNRTRIAWKQQGCERISKARKLRKRK